MCTPVNPLCNAYNMSSGICITCVTGYVFLSDSCLSLASLNPNCLTFSGLMCQKCSPGYYLGFFSACTQVSNTCATYYMSNGSCITCIAGYSISNGSCLSWLTLNPECASFDKGICLNCSLGYYLGTNSFCSAVSPFCNTTYDMATGNCLSCIYGYVLIQVSCISAADLNPNCQTFNNTICTNCLTGYYIGSDGNCTVVNSLCTTYIMTSGVCTGCVYGYLLTNSNCIATSIIMNNRWCSDFNGSTCTNCRNGYYIGSNGICTVVSSVCNTYDMNDGDCLSCFTGNALSNGTCIKTSSSNPYCTAFAGIYCTNCTNRYYLGPGPSYVCTAVGAACSAYIMTSGICISCYPGYHPSNGGCH